MDRLGRVFSVLQRPVKLPLWVYVATAVYVLLNIFEGVSSGDVNLWRVGVMVVVLYTGEWAIGRISTYSTDRALPQQWDHSGYVLTLRRDGDSLIGEVDGREAVRGDMSKAPLFEGQRIVREFRRVLERVAEAKRSMEDKGVSA